MVQLFLCGNWHIRDEVFDAIFDHFFLPLNNLGVPPDGHE